MDHRMSSWLEAAGALGHSLVTYRNRNAVSLSEVFGIQDDLTYSGSYGPIHRRVRRGYSNGRPD